MPISLFPYICGVLPTTKLISLKNKNGLKLILVSLNYNNQIHINLKLNIKIYNQQMFVF